MNAPALRQDSVMQVRILTEQDAAAYQAIRLQSLQDHPEAFSSSFEEEVQGTTEETAQLLTSRNVTVYGAFEEAELIGIVALIRNTRPKLRHRATIGGMYVVPEARGRGVGKVLVDAAIAQAAASSEVEDLTLAVTCGNESARALYIKAGFQPYSIDPRFIKVGDQFFDIEWMMLSLREAKPHG